MKMNSVFLDHEKMDSIRDVKCVVVKLFVFIDQTLLISQRKIEEFGKKNIKRKILKPTQKNAEDGTQIIWKEPENCLWLLLRNICKPRKVEKKEIKETASGKRRIEKNAERTTSLFIGLKLEKLFDLINVLRVLKNAFQMVIMKIIQNLLMSFGYVLDVILICIIHQNFTVREQARKLRKEMRCSEPKRKPWEIHRNDVSAIYYTLFKWLISNSLTWQSGGKSRFIYLPPGYNNDPCIKVSVQVKPLVIDLEAYDESYGDKGQAYAA